MFAARPIASVIVLATGDGGFAVYREPLRARQRGDRGRECVRRGARNRDYGAAAPEGADAEWSSEARRATGRQHVVGAGGVVAEGGRSPAAHEYAAGDPPAGDVVIRTGEGKLEVLGREGIGKRERGLDAGRGHEPERGVVYARPLPERL